MSNEYTSNNVVIFACIYAGIVSQKRKSENLHNYTGETFAKLILN